MAKKDDCHTVRIPLPGGRPDVTLTGPLPLSPAEWDYLAHVLDVMKPGLVKDGTEGSSDGSD